jgi:hypothetical protein
MHYHPYYILPVFHLLPGKINSILLNYKNHYTVLPAGPSLIPTARHAVTRQLPQPHCHTGLPERHRQLPQKVSLLSSWDCHAWSLAPSANFIIHFALSAYFESPQLHPVNLHCHLYLFSQQELRRPLDAVQ